MTGHLKCVSFSEYKLCFNKVDFKKSSVEVPLPLSSPTWSLRLADRELDPDISVAKIC